MNYDEIFLEGYYDALIDIQEGLIGKTFRGVGTGLNSGRKLIPTVGFATGTAFLANRAVKHGKAAAELSKQINSKEMQQEENKHERAVLNKQRRRELVKSALSTVGSGLSTVGAIRSARKLPGKFIK